MLLDTFDVLEAHNLLSKTRMARKITDLLLSRVVGKFEDVDTNAMLVADIRVALVGKKYSDDAMYELDDMIGEMTRPKSLVQDELGDGAVLCSAPIRRKFTNGNGTPIVIQKAGRFVSDNADVIHAFRWEPAAIRYERQAASMREMMAIDMMRVPGLAAHRMPFIERAHRAVQAELPKGS